MTTKILPQIISKKELIINAFLEMNIGMLEILLDDEKTYDDISKIKFLEKLDNVFQNFKMNNDTLLVATPGQCSTFCNKGCAGFRFMGDQSQNHIDIIFKESEHTYEDIFECIAFKTDLEQITNQLLSLDIESEDNDDVPF